MFLRSSGVSVGRRWRLSVVLFPLCALLLILSACAGKSGTLILLHGKPALAAAQELSIPLIGTTDVNSIDPASNLDESGKLLAGMLYSGLVRQDEQLQVVPDQATWQISGDGKTYTFSLNPAVTFADGSPVTAQTYVDSWTSALKSAAASAALPPTLNDTSDTPLPYTLALPIAGADALYTGHAQSLAGVQAVDAHTLRVTLTQPTATFLQSLAQPFFFPVNQSLVSAYAQQPWPVTIAEHGIGTGPFIVKQWNRDISLVLVPNTHYYGPKLTLTQLTVYFMNDPQVAYIANRAGHFDLTYNMVTNDQLSAKKLNTFSSTTLLQTDALFFNVNQAPFNSKELRQAFASALDKQRLANVTLQGVVTPAETLFPPTMTGYQAAPASFNAAHASQLLKSAIGSGAAPSITFTYPQSALSVPTATAMQSMWQQSLGIHVNLHPLQDDAYVHALSTNSIQFGLYTWTSQLDDPSDFASRLLSTSTQNAGQWQNAAYDSTVKQAETASGADRLRLYDQAEQIALHDAAIVPLFHDTGAALVGPWVQGISYNAMGLYFGDWSQVKILNHNF
ncbi:peptide ABC transporter substrate-binding protein [Ktedonobacteria bacterium brp13]|nr:peptide ABC transporter substrate-binding protein [Ktedonobacteria bacterium brp13]